MFPAVYFVFLHYDKIYNKLNNICLGARSLFFLCSLCLNVDFLEVYTDTPSRCVVCMQIKYQI